MSPQPSKKTSNKHNVSVLNCCSFCCELLFSSSFCCCVPVYTMDCPEKIKTVLNRHPVRICSHSTGRGNFIKHVIPGQCVKTMPRVFFHVCWPYQSKEKITRHHQDRFNTMLGQDCSYKSPSVFGT